MTNTKDTYSVFARIGGQGHFKQMTAKEIVESLFPLVQSIDKQWLTLNKEWIEDLKEKAETERWNIVSHMNQKWLNANDIREDTKATDTILFRLEKIYEQMEKCEDGLNNLKKYKGVRI